MFKNWLRVTIMNTLAGIFSLAVYYSIPTPFMGDVTLWLGWLNIAFAIMGLTFWFLDWDIE
jgi:hypothetical protein